MQYKLYKITRREGGGKIIARKNRVKMPMVEYGTADVKQHFEEREERTYAGN